MITIKGNKIKGEGAASHTIPLQFSTIVNGYREILNCFKGTININLEKDLYILNPDYKTQPIKWHPAMQVGEIFDFLKIKLFLPRLNKEFDAWIYVAHHSPHRKKLNFHEVLCEKIDDLRVDEKLELKITKHHYSLDYLPNIIFIG